MIRCSDFRKHVIQATLLPLNLYNRDVEELLIATMAQESRGGYYLVQTNGPALGVYQMEPATHDTVKQWAIYTYKLEKLHILDDFKVIDLVGNLYYSTVMARLNYLYIEKEHNGAEFLPPATDLDGIWKYYKKWWNTPLGAATQHEFYSNYHNYVTG